MLVRCIRAFLIILSFAVGAPALAQAPVTVTLRDGLNGYAGAWDVDPLQAFPDTTRGSVTVLNTNHSTSMVLLRFAIFASEGGPVPNDATITSATLSLYKYEGPTSVYEIRRVKKNWQEAEATWNSAASGLPWQTAGALGGDDVEAVESTATAPLTGWFNINVTAGVQFFKANPGQRFGWRMGWQSGTTGVKSFWSSDRQQEIHLRPQLVITYTEGGDPEPGQDTPPAGTTDAGSLGSTIPTFHSMSLYYNPATPPGCSTSNYGACKVWMRYRKSTEPDSALREGYPLWFDLRGSADGAGLPYAFKARGSAVHLEPNQKYYFQLGTGSSFATATWLHHVAGTTWNETFATDGAATPIPSGSGPFVITAGGTNGYKVYDGCLAYNGTVCATKAVINRGGAGTTVPETDSSGNAHAIVVRASNVIVRNVRATGAAMSGIYVASGFNNVVIEDSQVDGWAHRPGVDNPNWDEIDNPNPNSWSSPDPWGWSAAGGVHLAGNNSGVVVQRNIIKEPRYGSFPWDTLVSGFTVNCNRAGNLPPKNHPHGPNGITVNHGGTQNVIRYNEITGHPTDKKKWYLDGIGGAENFSAQGTPGSDSDIYQNIIMHVFDDAIESEGSGRNVRVWGNYMGDVKSAVATSTVHFGPHYTWRNVVNRVRQCYQIQTNPDNDWFSAAFKLAGSKQGFGNGARYLFHNTLLQDNSNPATPWEGAGRGIEAEGNGSLNARFTVARNNIFHVKEDATGSPSHAWSLEVNNETVGGVLVPPVGSSFAHNLINGRVSFQTQQAETTLTRFTGQLDYKPGHGYQSDPTTTGGTGNYQLEAGTGLDLGEIVPNFSDGFLGSAPDMGAHESGNPNPMKFGITAGQ